MKIKSRFVAAIVTFSLALMMPLSFNSCSPEDKPEVENPNVPEGPETPDKPENPEPEPKPETYCYKLLTETRADWEGDWIIAYVDGNEIFALHSGDADRGMGYAKKINGYTPSDEIPVETGDDYKAVIRKDGDAYVIKVNGIGYIGSSGDKKMIFSESEVAGDQNFRWTVSFDGGYVDLKPVNQDKTLQYNVSAACFRFYTSGQKPLKMFMKSVSTGESGGGNKPDPNPDPEPTPDPDPSNLELLEDGLNCLSSMMRTRTALMTRTRLCTMHSITVPEARKVPEERSRGTSRHATAANIIVRCGWRRLVIACISAVPSVPMTTRRILTFLPISRMEDGPDIPEVTCWDRLTVPVLLLRTGRYSIIPILLRSLEATSIPVAAHGTIWRTISTASFVQIHCIQWSAAISRIILTVMARLTGQRR